MTNIFATRRSPKRSSINLATVLIALRNGFGVEDIAVGTGQPVKRIRGMVETLRKRGILANVREWKGKASQTTCRTTSASRQTGKGPSRRPTKTQTPRNRRG